MKVHLYLDVWPGCDLKYLCANSTKSYEKSEGYHRIQIVADIPDWMIAIPSQPDHVVIGVASEE